MAIALPSIHHPSPSHAPRRAWLIGGGLLACSLADATVTAFTMGMARQLGTSTGTGEGNPVLLALGSHSEMGVLVAHIAIGLLAALGIIIGSARIPSRSVVTTVGTVAVIAYLGFLIYEVVGLFALITAHQQWAATAHYSAILCGHWRAVLPTVKRPSVHAAIQSLLLRNC